MPPIHLLKRYVSLRLIIPLLLLSGCYPIEDSPTGPVMQGEATVTIGEDEYTASATAQDVGGREPLLEILFQIDDTTSLSIKVVATEPAKFTHKPNAREFTAHLRYDDPSAVYLIDRGTLRIDSFNDEHVRGALDIYMLPLSGGNLVDHHNLLQVSGEFNATVDWNEPPSIVTAKVTQ
ncbi:MAG: hypothetical protein GF372_07495 [Candidatus Marinimicrobia bacterium]|nr:hypothetical protein [Candidatus Neomarinimicrobiota bacterium]